MTCDTRLARMLDAEPAELLGRGESPLAAHVRDCARCRAVAAALAADSTALVSAAQQLAVSSGVALGASVVEITQHFSGGGALQASDFPPAFLAISVISALSVLIFLRLSPDAGAEMTDRAPAPSETPDSRAG